LISTPSSQLVQVRISSTVGGDVESGRRRAGSG
jgi:hypothetical protein